MQVRRMASLMQDLDVLDGYVGKADNLGPQCRQHAIVALMQ
jgi:hypothetical protein